MCAIAGIIGLPFDMSVERKMLETMKRRGPDEQGTFNAFDCCLLHTRLSIIDPDGGKQPMTTTWNDEVFTIVYNGELYNTDEVRLLLCKEGHHFNGHSDTEVVLHAFAQWKDKSLDYLNGIFAFAVWCHNEEVLFVARDRIGVKPLFYCQFKGGFLFSSEIKTLFAYPGVQPQIDREGIVQLFMIGPGRVPGTGVFYGIGELEPGCYGWYRRGNWYKERYWSLKDREHTDSFEETAEHVRFLVIDAIRRQTVSDVPVGTFLSGGLDSSIISSVCAEQYANNGFRLQTFSVDYKNNDKFFVPGKFQPNSDEKYIKVMCDHIGSIHHSTVLETHDLVAAVQDATKARDLPGMADVDFSLLIFCGEIRKHVKVALSGECADEIFGGYPWFRDPEVRAMEGFPWAQNTKHRHSFIQPSITSGIDPTEYVMDHYRQTIDQCDILPGTSRLERRMKQMVNLNMRWFMQTLLDRKDRMSMYHGLEVRVPFCDYRIAEYMYGVPWEYKDYKGREKGLLRHAMESYLPNEVAYRKKSPYPKTFDPEYLHMVTALFQEMIQSKYEPIHQIVRREALNQLIETDFSWPWYGQLMRLPQTIAYLLQINYWLKEYNVQIR